MAIKTHKIVLVLDDSEATIYEQLVKFGDELCLRRFLELVAQDTFLNACGRIVDDFTDALNDNICEESPEPSALLMCADDIESGDLSDNLHDGVLDKEVEITLTFDGVWPPFLRKEN